MPQQHSLLDHMLFGGGLIDRVWRFYPRRNFMLRKHRFSVKKTKPRAKKRLNEYYLAEFSFSHLQQQFAHRLDLMLDIIYFLAI